MCLVSRFDLININSEAQGQGLKYWYSFWITAI